MTPPAKDVQLPAVLHVDGVPDGLTAVPIWRTRTTDEGQRVVVRRRAGTGSPRLGAVDLVADPPPQQLQAPHGWWLELSSRRPPGLEARFGERWWFEAVAAARRGVVMLRCEVSGPPWKLGILRRTILTPAAARLREIHTAQRTQRNTDLRTRAGGVLDAVRPLCGPLAAALETARPGTMRFTVLLAAAEDLTTGVVHSGARAFSQLHLGSTKQADVVSILREAGVTDPVLQRLGLATSDLVGVGGAAWLTVDGGRATTRGFAGVTHVRIPQDGLRLRRHPSTRLVVVENRHAAMWLADHFGHAVGVVWVTGMPSDAAVMLLVQANGPVVVVPDADLGGVLIADRLLEALPSAELVDVGPFAAVGQPWSHRQHDQLAAMASRDDAVGEFAAACLERGGPVEQEQAMPQVAELLGLQSAASVRS